MNTTLQQFLSQFNTVQEKIDALKDQYAISATNDPEIHGSFYSLNYSQLDSPKTSDIVRQCRSIIVDLNTNEIKARSFDRFFNYGEAQNIVKIEITNDGRTVAKEKIDGSIFLFYNVNGIWYPASRKTTSARNAMMKYNDQPVPMLQIVNEYFNIGHDWELVDSGNGLWIEISNYMEFIAKLQDKFKSLDKTLTYVTELVSKYNTVISQYNESGVYLLDSVTTANGERHGNQVSMFMQPESRIIYNESELYDFIKHIQQGRDYFVEGIVVEDGNGNLAKVKTAAYVAAHLAGGEEPTNVNSILRVVSQYEEDEYLTYFPQYANALAPYIRKRDTIVSGINSAIVDATDMKSQGATNKDISVAIQQKFGKEVLGVVMRVLNTGEALDLNPSLIAKLIK